MTGLELKQMIDEFKEEGYTEEDLLAAFYQMYKNGEFDEQDLEVAVNFLGYSLTDEFKNMNEEEKRSLDEIDYEKENEISDYELEEMYSINYEWNHRISKNITKLPYDLIVLIKGRTKNAKKPFFIVDTGIQKIPMYLDYFDMDIVDEYKERGIETFEGIDEVRKYVKDHYITFNNYLYTYINDRLIDAILGDKVAETHPKLQTEYEKALNKDHFTLSDILGMDLTIKEELELLEMIAKCDSHEEVLKECTDAINSLKYALDDMIWAFLHHDYNKQFLKEYINKKRMFKELFKEKK